MNHRPPSHFSFHPAFEKWCNSHFGAGLVPADGCDGSGFLWGLSPSTQPLAAPSLFLPALHPMWCQKNLQCSQCHGHKEWRGDSSAPSRIICLHQTGAARSVSFHCQLGVLFLSKLLIFFTSPQLCHPVQRETRVPRDGDKTRQKAQHKRAEPKFNKLSIHGKLWAS